MTSNYISAKEKNITNRTYRKELYCSPSERKLILADLAALPSGSQITAMAEIKKGQPFAAIFKLVEQGWKDEHGFFHQADDVFSFFSALCSGGFSVSIVID